MSGNISTIQGYLADVTPVEKRPGRMGLLGSAFSMGMVTGPAIGGLLARPDQGVAGFLAAAPGRGGAGRPGRRWACSCSFARRAPRTTWPCPRPRA